MTFGPTEVHKCPLCRKLYLKRTLRSGNTIGARYYTDGKMIAPMQEEFPQITKCEKCETYFWLNNPVEELDDISNKYPEAVYSRFLTPHEYQESIELKSYTTLAEESFLRMKLWYTFNDRIRDMSPDSTDLIFTNTLFTNPTDSSIYEDNCLSLKNLLDKNDENKRISIAELNRNLGQFVEAIALLDSILDPKYKFAVSFIKRKCEERFRFTCLINV